ncbi:Zn(2)-C6 fungal-type domain-containing protein [Mycena sanguinolenta]|uniref:Zn(2)-C6 fungal-type domain-containing protein n=1 Tax=Mycena sanguinolenta TaxID=230812 RepID=A0A8H6ZI77_9AGAR|nr:Zn(2)-C6 fungal-type domain-containing protein [Mycena sanguinolenta]
MTSTPLDDGHDSYQGKKRRIQRACDVCRRKKIACDGSQILGTKCTTCSDAKLDCTYVEIPAKRPPSKSYLDLETRLEHADALVRQLRAELANVRAELANSPSANPSSNAGPPDSGVPLAQTNRIASPTTNIDLDVPAAALCLMRSTLTNIATLPTVPHVDDVSDLDIGSKFEKLQVGSLENAFIGKSSGTFLINAALDLKPDANRKNAKETNNGTSGPGAWASRRLRYWTWKSPDNTMLKRSPFKFPSDTLMTELFELYFTRQNILLPLLHRPTFERSVAEKLHLRDDSFAGTVLLVCAIGSRWSVNPNMADAGLDCGREWFDQVELAGNSSCLLGHATLYDVQRYCLAAQFLKTSSLPQTYWTLVGVGLRLTQDLGLHRGKIRSEMPSAERELQKRAFWVLVYLDRVASCDLGRTCVVQFSDFDIPPLLEVDDEYWEHPTHPFQQPAHKPSRITFFNAMIRLSHILAFSLHVLYSLNKIRDACSITEAWEEAAIAELDSSLNNWRDQIPDYLRWDPMREDPVFFNQSVTLWCSYYHLQITIHRPFIPMLGRKPTILPALTICTNAARACANLVDIQRRRNGSVPFPLNLTPVVISGLVLLLKILSGKLSGPSDPSHEMANVQKCMEVIRLCEARWQTAGMYWDVLAELGSVGQLPRPTVADSAGDRSDSSTPNDTWSPFATLSGTPEHHTQPSAPYSIPFASTSAAFPSENTVEDIYTDPTQASRELADLLGSDALAMWTNVPKGFAVEDWGAYFSSFTDMDQWSANGGTTY